MLLLDAVIVGDSVSARAMVAELYRKLSPAPLAGWMLGFVEPLVEKKTQTTFVTESDPKGNPWAALAPSTIEDRVSQGFAEGPIQYRTGELYAYFKDNKSDILATQIGTQMTWPGQPPTGEKLPYKVGSAQTGNSRTGAPPRPVMGLTLQDGAEITAGLFEYLIGVRV